MLKSLSIELYSLCQGERCADHFFENSIILIMCTISIMGSFSLCNFYTRLCLRIMLKLKGNLDGLPLVRPKRKFRTKSNLFTYLLIKIKIHNWVGNHKRFSFTNTLKFINESLSPQRIITL